MEASTIFRYKKKKLNTHLIMGMLWLILGAISLLYLEDRSWFNNAYIPIGILFLLIYAYDFKYGYAAYRSPLIKLQFFPRKQFDLTQLKTVKRDFNGITLISNQGKKIVIDSSIIKKEDIIRLNKILENYTSKHKKVEN